MATTGLGLALPLVGLPLATDPFMPLRTLVLGGSLAAGVLVPSRTRVSRRLVVGLVAAGAVFVLAALVGPTPLLSLLGRYPRYEGLPMVVGYALAVAVGAKLLSRPKTRDAFVSALALAAAANAVVSLGQAVVDPGSRVTGLLSNSTTLGTFGLVALLVVGWQVAEGGRRALLWAGTAGSAVCVVLSASRGVLVGAAAALVVGLILSRRRAPRQPWWVYAATAAVLTAGVLLVPATSSRVTGSSPFAESTITGRILLWQEAVRLWLAHPVLGTGPSRFVDAINPFHTTTWAAAVGPYAPPDSPHDLALQVLCSTGLLGAAALVGLGVLLVLDARTARSGLLVPAAMTAVGLLATYSTSFTDPVTTTLGALVIGGAVGVARGEPSPRPVRLAASAATGGVALVLGVSLLVSETSYSAVLTAAAPRSPALTAIASRPWDPDTTRRVAYTLGALAQRSGGDVSYVVGPLRQACDRLPGSVECLLTLSTVEEVSKDHAASLAAAEAVLAIDPTDVDAYLAQGIALAGLTRYTEAEAAFIHASELRPTAAEPWSDLANLYDLTGRSADATAARAKAQQLSTR